MTHHSTNQPRGLVRRSYEYLCLVALVALLAFLIGGSIWFFLYPALGLLATKGGGMVFILALGAFALWGKDGILNQGDEK